MRASDLRLTALASASNNCTRKGQTHPLVSRTETLTLTWLSNFRTYMIIRITKLCRQQAEVIQNHENANVRNIGQSEA
jgi:hypothetical protein